MENEASFFTHYGDIRIIAWIRLVYLKQKALERLSCTRGQEKGGLY